MKGILKLLINCGLIFPVVILPGLICQCDDSPEEYLINIPDDSFRSALIAAGIDKNGDGQISSEEAGATSSIVLPPSGISDMTGLEAFVLLESLSISLNPITVLDLSANTLLRNLECSSCELTALDVTRNPALEELICGRNRLEELDLSQNRSLETLVCNNNLLTRLDLSVNTGLVKMISCGNQLTYLDISENTALQILGFDNMPMLMEVCVWTLPFPPPGVSTLQEYSPNVVFTDQCPDS
jgi:Leucine-rich repeat (LRR) protein